MRDLAARGEPITKGRVSQLFDDDEPFGERAAMSLAERLGLRNDFFLGPAEPEPLGVAEPSDNRYRLNTDHRISVGAVGVRMGANNTGKSDMLAAVRRFAALAQGGVPAPRRRLLAQAVASMFEDGPADATTEAIDALTRELDGPAAEIATDDAKELARLREWHNAIFSMAEHEPPPDRERIVKFLVRVQQAIAERHQTHESARTPSAGRSDTTA